MVIRIGMSRSCFRVYVDVCLNVLCVAYTWECWSYISTKTGVNSQHIVHCRRETRAIAGGDCVYRVCGASDRMQVHAHNEVKKLGK